MAVHDLSQLKKDYGREQADVIMNITGNIISGQVSGETARQLSGFGLEPGRAALCNFISGGHASLEQMIEYVMLTFLINCVFG